MVENLINEGSGLVIEDINRFFVNVSLYQPFYGSSYVNLPVELLHSRKRMISIKNKDFKCFLWCYVRAINPVKRNPKKITKHDKKIVNKLRYSGIDFPPQENDYKENEERFGIFVNVFGYEGFCRNNSLTYPIYVSKKTHKKYLNLLLITPKNKSHYVFSKDFNRFIFSKTKCKNKKYFCKRCLKCFSNENVLSAHCLLINGAQNVKLEKEVMKLENFKIYGDFECNLQRLKSLRASV